MTLLRCCTNTTLPFKFSWHSCNWLYGEQGHEDSAVNIHADKRQAVELFKRYNQQSVSENVTIVPGLEGSEATETDNIFRFRAALLNTGNKALHITPFSHRSYDPLSYVVLIPYGQGGWHFRLPFCSGRIDRKGRKLISMLFYSYKLFQRRNTFSTLHRVGRLFQQYVED